MTHSLKPLSWISSLYIIQGLPPAIISQLAVLLLQRFGYNNTTITFLTGLFILPWALKIILAPIIVTYGTAKNWLITMQAGISLTLLFIAYHIRSQLNLLIISLGFLCLAFFAAINDIVTDGLYITRLSDYQQRFYIGVRTIFYQIGNFLCGGLALAMIAWMSVHIKNFLAWRYFFILLAIITFLTIWYSKKFFRTESSIAVKKTKLFSITLPVIIDDLRQMIGIHATRNNAPMGSICSNPCSI